MKFTTVVVSAHLLGRDPINLGVLVLDEEADRLHIRFLTDLDGIDPVDLEVIEGLPGMIEPRAIDMGPRHWGSSFELLNYKTGGNAAVLFQR